MKNAIDDRSRLEAIKHSGLMDSLPQETFDRLTRLAARMLGTPVAAMTLVDDRRQFFASMIGLPSPLDEIREVPLSQSLCALVVSSGEALVIGDARNDPMFFDHKAVTELGVGAYAGIPVSLTDGRALGSFCAIDINPRVWSDDDLNGLRDLAAIATLEVEARVSTSEHADGKRAAAELAERFRATFEQAAVGIFHLSLEGEWLCVNERLCAILGYTRDELLASSITDLCHLDEKDIDDRYKRQLLAGELSSYRVDRRYLHRAGHDIWATLTVSLVRGSEGSDDYLVSVLEDISERKGAEQALSESEASLRGAQFEMLARLAQAAELRDDDTGMHTKRVGNLSADIARALGLSETEVELIRHAAPLHDVGKIGIPDSILLKPAPLSANERRHMERHAAEGARILSGSDAPLAILAEEIALCHHERWDGKGYPRKLVGEEIPLAARIVAVADVHDALAHDRAYRSAWSHERVVSHVIEHSGTHFDPVVVRAFSAVMDARFSGEVQEAEPIDCLFPTPRECANAGETVPVTVMT